MKRNKYLLSVIAAAGICIAAAAISAAIPDNAKKYEIDAVVGVPEYKTDAARAIDAYERLMERYMDLSEQLASKTSGDCQGISAKLDSIAGKLSELSTRMARIEKALGIDPNSSTIVQGPK